MPKVKKMPDLFKIIESILGKGRVEKNKNLYPYLTLKTNNTAEFFFEAKTKEDLIKVKQLSLKFNLPIFILGGGSNLAVLHQRVKGLIVKNNYQEKEIIKENHRWVEIAVSSGYLVSRLVTETIESGVGGFEYHKGLPGTVGGAIYMNSKWTRPLSYISDNLKYVYLIDNKGRIKEVDKDYFQFTYGYSILQKTKEIVLTAIFRLKKTDPAIVKRKAEEVLNYRRETQPLGAATAGCFFKNIGSVSAGYLIDKAGLKGYRIGDFYVSNKHANFIINKGNGKPKDLKKLLNIIKEKVRKKFGVNLKEEVILM